MKKRFGDRKDATRIRDIDSTHFIVANVWPKRADNEAFIMETIEMEKIDAYLAKKNYEGIDYKYNVFQILVTAIAKTIVLKPQLNRFIRNGLYYQKDWVSTAFVVKKKFAENSGETVAYLIHKDDETIDDVHEYIRHQVMDARSDKLNSTDNTMDIITKLPAFLAKFIARFVLWLDKRGWVPFSVVANDGFSSSCFISNLGSIKMEAGYHHLTNWGTCSMFCTIGQIKEEPLFDHNGFVKMRRIFQIGLTIDERIADGYYYSQAVRLIKHLLENPELLERPIKEEVDF